MSKKQFYRNRKKWNNPENPEPDDPLIRFIGFIIVLSVIFAIIKSFL